MIIKYKLIKKYSELTKQEKRELVNETLQSVVSTQNLLVKTAKIVSKNNILFVGYIWLISRFYSRLIDEESINYNLFLLK